MIGGSKSRGEAAEKALFARRARAMPAPALPSLEAILAEADAPAAAAPRRPFGRTGMVVGLSVLAAACVGGLVVASAHAAGDFGNRAIVADVDAGTSYAARRTAAGAAMERATTCQPDDDENPQTCGAPQASFVVAASEPQQHSCTEPEPRPAAAPPPTSCEHETALVCMP